MQKMNVLLVGQVWIATFGHRSILKSNDDVNSKNEYHNSHVQRIPGGHFAFILIVFRLFVLFFVVVISLVVIVLVVVMLIAVRIMPYRCEGRAFFHLELAGVPLCCYCLVAVDRGSPGGYTIGLIR